MSLASAQRKKRHSAMPRNLSGATAVHIKDWAGRCRLNQSMRSTDTLHRSLSSSWPVVSASSAVMGVRIGKFKCRIFKTSSVYCLLGWQGCTRRESFPGIFAEVVQNLSPLSLSWNFNFCQKGIFHWKWKCLICSRKIFLFINLKTNHFTSESPYLLYLTSPWEKIWGFLIVVFFFVFHQLNQ